MYDGGMGGDGVAALAGVVENLALVPLAEEIEQVLWVRDRLDAKISEALRGFDAEQAWGSDGSLSLTSWLAAHGRQSRRDAYREATVARRLGQLPVTEAAWSDGTLSSGQVAAIVANVSSDRAGLYAQHEPEMTPLLAELSVADTAAAMRAWRLHADAEDDGPEPPERPSELYLSRTLDGRRELSGHLGAEDASVVEAAIAAAEGGVPADGEGPMPSAPQRRAEALVDICRWFLTNCDKATSGARNRPQLSVIVSLSDLATDRPGRMADGTAVRPVLPRAWPATRYCTASSWPGVRPSWTMALACARLARRCGPPWSYATAIAATRLRPPAVLVRSPPRNTFLQGRPHVPFQPGHGL